MFGLRQFMQRRDFAAREAELLASRFADQREAEAYLAELKDARARDPAQSRFVQMISRRFAALCRDRGPQDA